MKTKILGVVAVAAVLAGCGGSSTTTSALCEKAADVATKLQKDLDQCAPGNTTNIPTSATCEPKLESCTEADRAVLNTYLDCLNGVPACTTATAQDWANKATACQTPVGNGLSANCKTSLEI